MLANLFLHPCLIMFSNISKINSSWQLFLFTKLIFGFEVCNTRVNWFTWWLLSCKENNFPKMPFLPRWKCFFYFLNVSAWHYPGPNETYHKTPMPLQCLWHITTEGLILCLCSLCSIKNLGKPDWQFRWFPICTCTRLSYRCTLVHCNKRCQQENPAFSLFLCQIPLQVAWFPPLP